MEEIGMNTLIAGNGDISFGAVKFRDDKFPGLRIGVFKEKSTKSTGDPIAEGETVPFLVIKFLTIEALDVLEVSLADIRRALKEHDERK